VPGLIQQTSGGAWAGDKAPYQYPIAAVDTDRCSPVVAPLPVRCPAGQDALAHRGISHRPDRAPADRAGGLRGVECQQPARAGETAA